MRRLREGDEEFFCRLYTCPDVMAEISAPLTMAQANDAFVRACAYNLSRHPGHRFWVACVGVQQIGLAALIRSERSAELGLMLLPEAWTGKFSKAIVHRVINHAFRAMRIDELLGESTDGVRERVSRRLLHPYPFVSVETPPGRSRWKLTRDAWQHTRDEAHAI